MTILVAKVTGSVAERRNRLCRCPLIYFMGTHEAGATNREQERDTMHNGGHFIRFVDDEALPDGLDWAFVEFDCDLWLAVKRSRLSEGTLEDAWTAYRSMREGQLVGV